jgi:hypothetical protein
MFRFDYATMKYIGKVICISMVAVDEKKRLAAAMFLHSMRTGVARY